MIFPERHRCLGTESGLPSRYPGAVFAVTVGWDKKGRAV